MSAGATHVALLRGINVGGKNKLPMKTLVELFQAAGCEDVRTYIQSGNVVFRAPAKVLGSLSSVLSAAIAQRLGLQVPLVLRSAVELETSVRKNPFLKRRIAPEFLHLAFLAEVPEKRRAAALDPARSPGDAFALVGRELYLWLPNGVARTKLTNAYLDRTLATISTVRNWRTATTLAEMANE